MQGILASNVGQAGVVEAPRKRSGSPTATILLVALVMVLGGAAVLIWSIGRSGSSPATDASPTPLARPTLAAGLAKPSAVSAPLPAINDISCDTLEATIFHIHAHLALFIDGQEQIVPFGIGIGQPWQVTNTAEGPFVTDGSCFYWIHTHTQDGVLHIESPVRRSFTLGDFFTIWQQPLSATQMGPAQGTIIAYVNGSRVDTSPPDIRLLPHERIQLDIGQDVPPQGFDFPPND